MVKAVYLAGNSYPRDIALETRVTQFLVTALGISTFAQSSLIPPTDQLTVNPLNPAVRLQTLSTLIESIDEPVILFGRSSGARIITKFAEQHPDKIAACVCFGYPFQSPGKPPEDRRTKHLQTLTVPTLIIQGSHDRYGHDNLRERFALALHTKILSVEAGHDAIYQTPDWQRITESIEKLIRFTTEQSVSQRCIFFCSGFDPRGARHYYDLFTAELAKADALSVSSDQAPPGPTYTVSKRRQTQPHTTQWGVDTHHCDQAPDTHTDFQFLGWDDIARKHWPTGRFKHWLGYLQVSHRYLLSGFFQKSLKLSPSAAVCFFSLNIVMLITALACLLIGVLAYLIGSTLVTSTASQTLLAMGAAGGCWLVWHLAHRFETSRKLDWIMRSYAFTARQAHEETPELDQRLDQFARQIVERLQQNLDDEIIIVGHSSGAMMAASALARAIALYPKLFQQPAKIGLLTLGQCIPMLGLLPYATKFRAELTVLSTQSDLLWVDLSSATDPICFSKVNPFDACGIDQTAEGQGARLCLLSPPFYLLPNISAATIKRAAVSNVHVQYLRRFISESPDNIPNIAVNHYLNISTGSPSLRKRFSRFIPSALPESFDAATYLRLNPDVMQSGISGEEHYRHYGAKEGRRFCIAVPAGFDPKTYLSLNPDVAQAGIDPMIHYTLYGVQENRRYQIS
jgi:predicted alpha/beta-hydrolase family hydrolase